MNQSRGENVGQTFRFEAWWILDDTFEKTMKELWLSVQGDIFYNFHHLREGLKKWALTIRKRRNKEKKGAHSSFRTFT